MLPTLPVCNFPLYKLLLPSLQLRLTKCLVDTTISSRCDSISIYCFIFCDYFRRYCDLCVQEGEGLAKNLGKLGSIGKSVGQKLRQKLSRNNSQRGAKPSGILSAQLHTDKRHEYHDAMINNYLHTARLRFHQQQDQLVCYLLN